jgi:hypothetical protein
MFFDSEYDIYPAEKIRESCPDEFRDLNLELL